MNTASLHRGSSAPLVNHLCPLMTYSSPSRSIRDEMFVASEDATHGSVIAKHERISPSSNGRSHCSFCNAVPNWLRISMLPVSGAEQLVASLSNGDVPITSHSGA